jgi:UDP-glucose 4-epimerase
MKVIVTGGAGFIGSHLLDRLVGGGADEIVAVDNFVRGRREHLLSHAGNPAVRLLDADIRDAELLQAAFDGATHVYHRAAQSKVLGAVTDSDYAFPTNVVGT